jgi:transposase
MTNEVELIHERVDDIPLLYGLMEKLMLIPLLDRFLGHHGLHQGASNGVVTGLWLLYILSEGDHRKSGVQDWVDRHRHTLERLLGQTLRVGIEANDDRLGIILRLLSQEAIWHGLEGALWQASVAAYQLKLTGVRLDSTTSYGYHTPREDGLMQLGHSKDHRPDLPQLKLMTAAAEPSGLVLGCNVLSGERDDAPLYLPLIQRVRQSLGQPGLLYTGDCKMAALDTRANIAFHQDYYLTSLPLSGTTAEAFPAWVEAVVHGEQSAELLFAHGQLLGGGYEFTRTLNAVVADQPVRWTERVQIFRSLDLAQRRESALEDHLAKAQAQLLHLTPPPAVGKRQFHEAPALDAAIQRIMTQHEVSGLLQVSYQREESIQHPRRRRPSAQTPEPTLSHIRYHITRVQRVEDAIQDCKYHLGWRNHVTNLPTEALSLAQTVAHYRGGWMLENDFHLLKDKPLGIQPLFVRNDTQIRGLTRLLTLALRLLTLLQTQVRASLLRSGQTLTGVFEGQPNRSTAQPTATRLLKAVAFQETTLTQVVIGPQSFWHLTPLSDLVLQILTHLDLAPSLYLRLTNNSP